MKYSPDGSSTVFYLPEKEVDEIVEAGTLDPESIITPHIFVNAIVKRGSK